MHRFRQVVDWWWGCPAAAAAWCLHVGMCVRVRTRSGDGGRTCGGGCSQSAQKPSAGRAGLPISQRAVMQTPTRGTPHILADVDVSRFLKGSGKLVVDDAEAVLCLEDDARKWEVGPGQEAQDLRASKQLRTEHLPDERTGPLQSVSLQSVQWKIQWKRAET